MLHWFGFVLSKLESFLRLQAAKCNKKSENNALKVQIVTFLQFVLQKHNGPDLNHGWTR
jgi:hypothetical protein